MPQKDFIIWLDERTYIRMDFVTVQGRMISFVVRLMWHCGNEEHNAARYDMAHGVPHRDKNGMKAGLIAKIWFPNDSPERVLAQAIKDFKKNYESYIEKFARG